MFGITNFCECMPGLYMEPDYECDFCRYARERERKWLEEFVAKARHLLAEEDLERAQVARGALADLVSDVGCYLDIYSEDCAPESEARVRDDFERHMEPIWKEEAEQRKAAREKYDRECREKARPRYSDF